MSDFNQKQEIFTNVAAVPEELDESPRAKRHGEFDSIIVGAPQSSKCIKINKEGIWFGGITSSSAVLKIGLDGSNNIVASSSFLSMTDTPSAYTTAGAIYNVNGTKTAVNESGVVLTEGTNTWTITKGTAVITALAGTNKLGSLAVGNLTIDSNGYLKPISSNDLAAPNNSIYFSTDSNTLCYKDNLGVSNSLY